MRRDLLGGDHAQLGPDRLGQPLRDVEVRREVAAVRQDHAPPGSQPQRRRQRLEDLDRQRVAHDDLPLARADQPRDPVAHAARLDIPARPVPAGDEHFRPLVPHHRRHPVGGMARHRPQRVAVEIGDSLRQAEGVARGGEVGHEALPWPEAISATGGCKIKEPLRSRRQGRGIATRCRTCLPPQLLDSLGAADPRNARQIGKNPSWRPCRHPGPAEHRQESRSGRGMASAAWVRRKALRAHADPPRSSPALRASGTANRLPDRLRPSCRPFACASGVRRGKGPPDLFLIRSRPSLSPRAFGTANGPPDRLRTFLTPRPCRNPRSGGRPRGCGTEGSGGCGGPPGCRC